MQTVQEVKQYSPTIRILGEFITFISYCDIVLCGIPVVPGVLLLYYTNSGSSLISLGEVSFAFLRQFTQGTII